MLRLNWAFADVSKVAALLTLGMALAFSGPSRAAEEATLYDRIGGYKGIAVAVDDLVDRIYVNETLNKNPALKAVHDLNERSAFKLVLATWVMENTGGPKVYFGRDLPKAHAHLNISNREFDVILHECLETFYKVGVGQKEIDELMAGLEAQRQGVVTAEEPKTAKN